MKKKSFLSALFCIIFSTAAFISCEDELGGKYENFYVDYPVESNTLFTGDFFHTDNGAILALKDGMGIYTTSTYELGKSYAEHSSEIAPLPSPVTPFTDTGDYKVRYISENEVHFIWLNHYYSYAWIKKYIIISPNTDAADD